MMTDPRPAIRQKPYVLLLILGVALAPAAVLAFILASVSGDPPKTSPKPYPRRKVAVPRRVAPPPSVPPSPPRKVAARRRVAPPPSVPPPEVRLPTFSEIPSSERSRGERVGLVKRLAAKMNMAGLAIAILEPTSYSKVMEDLRSWLLEAEGELVWLIARVDLADRPHLPVYFKPGDRIIAFREKRRDPNNPFARSRRIRTWLERALPGAWVLAEVERSGSPVVIVIHFAESDPDLTALASCASVSLGLDRVVGGGAVVGDGIVRRFPVAFVTELSLQLGELPVAYRKVMPPVDLKRADRLLRAGKGTYQDYQFLQNRMMDYFCVRYTAEVKAIQARIKILEARLGEVPTHELRIRDGRRVKGDVLKDSGDELRIRVASGEISLSRTAVLSVKLNPLDKEVVLGHYDEAKGSAAGMRKFAAWCEAEELKPQRELAWLSLILLEPPDEVARKAVRLPPLPR